MNGQCGPGPLEGFSRRAGVFGGTFDPIHNGHLAAAEEARHALGLEQVVFVPNWQQPLKKPGAATPAQRLTMVQLAIAGNERFVARDLELRRGGPSYTLDTLRTLRAEWADDVLLVFLLGADAARQFGTWHRPAEILALAHLAVLSRAGVREPDWAVLEGLNPEARERVHSVVVPDLNISASDLRRRLSQGQPVRYQVPEAVGAYIRRHGLYTE